MNEEQIYVVKGTRYEPGEIYPELGKVKTRVLGYFMGDPDEIRSNYDGQGFMRIEIEPIEVRTVRHFRGKREACVA